MSWARMALMFLVGTVAGGLIGQETALGNEAVPPPEASGHYRQLPDWPVRARGQGPAYFVDPKTGDDSHDGTEPAPWRTVQHAMAQLSPGDTLYLRGGIYFETLRCSVVGTADQPITIRSYPGERAIIDGGIPDFQTAVATAWEPAPDGPEGTYVSTRVYKNQRDMVGLLGDSLAGLTTYWYRRDLEATTGLVSTDQQAQTAAPYYCGPGIWYEQATGKIYCRLAPTDLQSGIDEYSIINYSGEQDPRRLPLVIAPFHARALHVDQAQHVRFLDLTFRGGGHETVRLDFGINIAFERCAIYAGTYGVVAKNTGPLTMTDSAVLGNIPPWAFREENCLYAYSPYISPPFLTTTEGYVKYGSGQRWQIETPNPRHIARMNTHALLVAEGFAEHEVFAYPFNHDWDVSRCEFVDSHDGVYLGGRNINFHHNQVAAVQDDAVYLSSPTPAVNDDIHVHHNLIGSTTSAFAMHGRGGPDGEIYVYRNVVDMRGYVQYNRGTTEKPQPQIVRGSRVFLLHGERFLIHQEHLFFYQNTCLFPVRGSGSFAGGLYAGVQKDASRWALNNLFLYYDESDTPLVPRITPTEADVWLDGNLHWQLGGVVLDNKWIEAVRNSPPSSARRQGNKAPWATASLAADPKLKQVSSQAAADNDYRLGDQSPAIKAGLRLPGGLIDPDAPTGGRPDIGALPLGSEPLNVGIFSRRVAGSATGLGLERGRR